MTCAFLKRIAIGRMNRSYFGFFRVKSSGTKQTLVTIRFHAFFFRLPDVIILKTSASACARTERKSRNFLLERMSRFFSTDLTFGKGNIPFASFLLALLLDHVRKNFRSLLILTIKKIVRHSAFLSLFGFLLEMG